MIYRRDVLADGPRTGEKTFGLPPKRPIPGYYPAREKGVLLKTGVVLINGGWGIWRLRKPTVNQKDQPALILTGRCKLEILIS